MSNLENGPSKMTLKRALCYVPLIALIFAIVEKNNKDLELDIRYWVILFAVWFVASMIGGLLWLWWLVFLLYIGGSWYLWYKAYNNEKIQVDLLDQIYEKVMWVKKTDTDKKEQ